MTKFRIEIDAIIAVIAETPEAALKQANEIAAKSKNVIVTGEDMSPTVLTLTDEEDLDSTEDELSRSEVEDLEAGREPDVLREKREQLEYQKRDAEGRTTDSLEDNCEDCGNAAYVVVNNRPLCDLHAQAELPA